jgi:hypothetical protein
MQFLIQKKAESKNKITKIIIKISVDILFNLLPLIMLNYITISKTTFVPKYDKNKIKKPIRVIFAAFLTSPSIFSLPYINENHKNKPC